MSSSSGSDRSSNAGKYKNLKQITRDRLLHEMLRSCPRNSTSPWDKVLITDELTVKIVSCACRLSDITNEGVPLVEHIDKPRQPLPHMDAIYFIQPTEENIIKLLSDMSDQQKPMSDQTNQRKLHSPFRQLKSNARSVIGQEKKPQSEKIEETKPLYRRAFVFFSSPISKELLSLIKENRTVLKRITALKEMNLEYLPIDSQGFVTNNEKALEQLYGDKEDSREGVACLNEMAARIATVFASLKEFPFVRYRVAKSHDPTKMATFSEFIPTKLAAGVWDSLMNYKKTIPDFPQMETCELLILDRSVDQIAPIIHEWTYEAMCHDLLDAEELKSLNEEDLIWQDLRHEHIADVVERLGQKMHLLQNEDKLFRNSNSELSTMQLQTTVRALPRHIELKEMLPHHIEKADKINTIFRELGLKELALLEQDLVFGDAETKDVVKYLLTHKDVTSENKLRLLMIHAAIYPEKSQSLMKLAKLSPPDMNAVNSMRLLGVGGSTPDSKKKSKKNILRTFSLKFDIDKIHKKKRLARKERPSSKALQFSRFYTILEETVEKLSKGELSKEDYPCLNDPSPTSKQAPPPPRSVRTRWTPSDLERTGTRIFVFIAGGATRSELRDCHKLTKKLNRDVFLGSSSFDDPADFIKKLRMKTDCATSGPP